MSPRTCRRSRGSWTPSPPGPPPRASPAGTRTAGGGRRVALRAAVAGRDPPRHQVIYIPNPAFGTRGLYVTIVRALGAQPRYLKAELMAQAGDLLAAETAERHRRVVLICDE